MGLKSVKEEIRNLADSIFAEQERARLEERQPNVPMCHYQFLGNPGTGKTTVARIMGNIFHSLGLLPTNKLLEVKPADLISGFVGQTAAQTRKMVKRGLGGVFFIDEAYGLHDGHYGEKGRRARTAHPSQRLRGEDGGHRRRLSARDESVVRHQHRT